MTENKCESNHVRSKGSANEGFPKTGAAINDVHKEMMKPSENSHNAAQRITRPSRRRVRVSVVIPTLNEAANLPHVFARFPAEDLHEVILVDGHSTDDTIEVARQLWPSIRVVMQDGKGKGNALACGFAAVRGDIVVMIDADGSTDPEEIPAYVDALLAGADFAKGSRFMDGGGSVDITPVRGMGNRFLNGVVNVLYGTKYSDLCYGYNAFWSDVLPVINVDCAGFEVETLINVRIAKAGLDVVEVPSIEQERIHGVSKLHPIRDGLRVLRTILSERFKRSADKQDVHVPAFRELEYDVESLHDRFAQPLAAQSLGR
jgi:glycosyltransferase involved in cell wall biosynthesis